MTGVQTTVNNARDEKRSLMAVLLDPDKITPESLDTASRKITDAGVDLLLVGGSLMVSDGFETSIQLLKSILNIPVIIFPGHPMQISQKADAILLLSLISGRNPELLIGQHVHAAPVLRRSGLEILSTGYILIDGEMPTTVSYMSNTQPIPRSKPDIAACTAMAGEMLGMKNIYLEAGSGAKSAVPGEIVRAVKDNCTASLFVGGGIRDAETASGIARSGASVVVVGTVIERDLSLLAELADAVHGTRVVSRES